MSRYQGRMRKRRNSIFYITITVLIKKSQSQLSILISLEWTIHFSFCYSSFHIFFHAIPPSALSHAFFTLSSFKSFDTLWNYFDLGLLLLQFPTSSQFICDFIESPLSLSIHFHFIFCCFICPNNFLVFFPVLFLAFFILLNYCHFISSITY